MRHLRRAAPCTGECFLVSTRCSMFHPYCAWGGEFLRLASLWSTRQWNSSLEQQPMLHFSKIDFPAEWDPRSCMHATKWFLILKWVCRGRYVSTKRWKRRRITSLNDSNAKLRFARRSLFQATIQLISWIAAASEACGSVSCAIYMLKRGCHTMPRLASASSVFLA